ncbi:MAG: hypothetical protein B6241_01735 [Spirochaetaceae bacterium 4572_59]|nr:MAG: hypothetical protein B6241_01735 [Spirochaetaceae bacterium 4572_59]
MKNFGSSILNQKEIAIGYREMTISWPQSLEAPLPGQFLTVKVTENPAPLLRRPFALSGFDREKNTASLIYQLRGPATRLMATLEINSSIEVLSPLGNNFTLPEKDETPLLVAGGIGLGPVLYLARELDKNGFSPRLVVGGRTESFLPDLSNLKNGSIHYCSDDGSAGFRGTAVDYLKSLDWKELPSARLYSCGPQGMLNACHNLALEKNIPSEVSMEQMMACGVGACMGCAIEVIGPEQYARVCKEGPVFDSRRIKWT